MSSSIPLIRAAAVMPFVRWMGRNGIPVQPRLKDAKLEYLPIDDPNRPVPLFNAAEFLRVMSKAEGNDIGCRVPTETTIEDLANLGLVLMSAHTPRDALKRAVVAIPRHCTHEVITVEDHPEGVLLCQGWLCGFEPERLHLIQQYFATICERLCALTGKPGPYFDQIRMVPHPETHLDHLKPHFGGRAEPATRPCLELFIPTGIADAPLTIGEVGETVAKAPPEDWTRLRDDPLLSASARVAIRAMLPGGAPTVDDLAFSAGLSVRSLQRRLTEEGAGFTQLLDQVRCSIAKERFSAGKVDAAALARELGYSHPTALTRAVRRWTGLPPRKLQKVRSKPQR